LIRIEKDGSDILPNGSGSPHVVSDTGYFDVVPIVYQAFADYAAGAIKNYTPSGNVDARAALVRNANAPQAAENNFASATKILTGELYIFFGAFNLAPSNSSEVRKLPLKISTTEALSGVFVLFTGNIFQDFSICIPSGLNLVEVRDLDSGNVDITSSYVLNSFNVVDLAGNSNAYKNYIFPKGSPYSSNHHHQIKLA